MDEAGSRAQTLREAEWSEASDLVRRIEAGDPAAEDDLVSKYQNGVRMIVARASRDRSEVEDLSQDVLRLALEKIRARAVREPRRLSGFMAGLARTRVMEHYRRLDAHGSLEARARATPRILPPNALDDVLERERADIVRTVLRELPSDRDRQILVRYYLGDEDKARICQDLDLTPLNFNSVLFRARARFRDLVSRRMAIRGFDRRPR